MMVVVLVGVRGVRVMVRDEGGRIEGREREGGGRERDGKSTREGRMTIPRVRRGRCC